jgi:hypothetical protein
MGAPDKYVHCFSLQFSMTGFPEKAIIASLIIHALSPSFDEPVFNNRFKAFTLFSGNLLSTFSAMSLAHDLPISKAPSDYFIRVPIDSCDGTVFVDGVPEVQNKVRVDFLDCLTFCMNGRPLTIVSHSDIRSYRSSK